MNLKKLKKLLISRPSSEASESTIASLRAMLASLAPDVDVDAELDNVAFKRDGSPVYIGEVKELQAEAKTETKAKPPARTP